MSIDYRDNKEIAADQLAALFTALGWQRYVPSLPEMVARATWVGSAWQGDTLVGLVVALSDDYTHTMVSDLGVLPDYQRQGIGTGLMERLVARLAHTHIHLTSEARNQPFYMRFGFGSIATAMFRPGAVPWRVSEP